MQYIAESQLLKDFITLIEGTSLSGENVSPPQFPCRPATALTAERDTVISRFTGEIGIDRLDEFKLALHDLVTDRLHKIILDLSSVSLSRTTLGVLLDFVASVYGRNKKLYLYNPSQQIRESLDELQLTPLLSVLETHEDILITIFI